MYDQLDAGLVHEVTGEVEACLELVTEQLVGVKTGFELLALDRHPIWRHWSIRKTPTGV